MSTWSNSEWARLRGQWARDPWYRACMELSVHGDSQTQWIAKQVLGRREKLYKYLDDDQWHTKEFKFRPEWFQAEWTAMNIKLRMTA